LQLSPLSVAFTVRRHGNAVVPRFAQSGKRSLPKRVINSAARSEAFQTKQPKGKAFLTEKMQEWVITQRQRTIPSHGLGPSGQSCRAIHYEFSRQTVRSFQGRKKERVTGTVISGTGTSRLCSQSATPWRFACFLAVIRKPKLSILRYVPRPMNSSSS